jgi:hypothetical protein
LVCRLIRQLTWQLLTRQITGDTKAGTFIGADRYGNKYYENMTEELPRTLEDARYLWGYLLIEPCSPNTLGRLQGVRIRRVANRAGLVRIPVVLARYIFPARICEAADWLTDLSRLVKACLDFLHGGHSPDHGQGHAVGCAQLGAAGA